MTNDVAVITGSSGEIGTAIAIALASSGFFIAIGYRRNKFQAQAIVRDIESRGGRALAVEIDVTKEDQVQNIFETTGRVLGPITALVNCAGIVGFLSRVDTMPIETVRQVIDVNVVGTFLCSREAVLRMSTKKTGKGGGIVNISSQAAKFGSPNEWVHYAMSKGAIDTFTIGLAKEVASEGIRVNAVNPGLIDTKIHGRAGAPRRLEKLVGSVPMGRVGMPSEVAAVVKFLLSSEASYITGICLDVGGGR